MKSLFTMRPQGNGFVIETPFQCPSGEQLCLQCAKYDKTWVLHDAGQLMVLLAEAHVQKDDERLKIILFRFNAEISKDGRIAIMTDSEHLDKAIIEMIQAYVEISACSWWLAKV